MRAIILAAGSGTRLRPLTDDRPKVMVELFGRPILDYHLHAFAAHGITEVVVVTGHAAGAIPAGALRTHHNPRFAQSNMVESLFTARDELAAGDDVVIAYGDIVFEPAVLSAVLAVDAPAVVAVDRQWRAYWEARMADPLADAETLRLRDDHLVELGKPPSSYDDIEGQFMGLLRFRGDLAARLPAVYDAMDRRRSYDGQPFANLYMTAFLQYLIDTGVEIRAALVDNGWLEVDTLDDLRLYEDLHRRGDLTFFHPHPVRRDK